MASLASQLIQEVAAHTQRDSLEDARDICAGGTYFPNNLRINVYAITVNMNILIKATIKFPLYCVRIPVLFTFV
jgi:hypothetical protein